MVIPGHGLGYEAGIQDCLEGGKTSQVQRPKQKRTGSAGKGKTLPTCTGRAGTSEHRKLALKQLLEERTDQRRTQNGVWAAKG